MFQEYKNTYLKKLDPISLIFEEYRSITNLLKKEKIYEKKNYGYGKRCFRYFG